MSNWTSLRKELYHKLSRKKPNGEHRESNLKRVLNIYDLTALGTSSTLGAGVYILAGKYAKDYAGPAVVLSYVIAAVVSSFSGICYAEFAGRVPKAGSAYTYSYVVIGELVAFIIGWDLLLEHTLGNAVIAKATSNLVDKILGDPQKTFMERHLPIDIAFFSNYPDIAAFCIVMFTALLVAWGVRKSSNISNIFTALNLFTICTVIVSGIFLSDFGNWSIPKKSIPSSINTGGEGGFMPFGWNGVVIGAARCFYGYIGFDSLASTGEETKNPKSTIPLAIILSLFFATLAYSGVSTVLTLMAPYYDLDMYAPFSVIYKQKGLTLLEFLVTGGAMFALITTLIGTLFPIPRYLYAMSSDGLLFNYFSKIDQKTNTPLRASFVCGVFAGLLSCFFDLDKLIQMTAIGTLQSYTLVCICVLLLRYRNIPLPSQCTGTNPKTYEITNWSIWFNVKSTNSASQYVSRILIAIYTTFASVFCLCQKFWNADEVPKFIQIALLIAGFVSLVILLTAMVLFTRLPQAIEDLPFKTPLVPFVPCMGIILNIYLMVALEGEVWIRFTIWLIIGLFVYAFYGIHHSVEGKKKEVYANEGFKHELEDTN